MGKLLLILVINYFFNSLGCVGVVYLPMFGLLYQLRMVDNDE
jgi:hypothetical protein